MNHLLCWSMLFAGAAETVPTDVLIYGGTPAGIAAAAAAAESGRAVVLVEPTPRLGGMVASGLSHADFHAFEGLTGAYLDFTRRVQDHYRRKYGPDSPQARGNFRGTHAEPRVNLAVFESLLAERKTVAVVKEHRLVEVRRGKQAAGTRIESAGFVSPRGDRIDYAAKVYVDATYEGDLLAAAGVAYRIGREGKDASGESLAPDQGDGQLQGYNFRLIMTRDPGRRVTVKPPVGYRRADFAGILPLLQQGKLVRVFGGYSDAAVFKAQDPPLPNGIFDINDVSRGLVRLSLPGENLEWPEGDAAQRRKIFAAHLYWHVGLAYFLQNDEAVPAEYREEARQWGWCKDEFPDTDHLPPQLYVREARRMVGRYVFTQQDTRHAPNDARAVLRTDAVAIGEYGHNCHGTAHVGSKFGGKHVGEFYQSTPPYQIPYGVLCPKEVVNLLVPVACGSSHVGFCALRYETIWMNLGQAAGYAADAALATGDVNKVAIPDLQKRLHAAGAATVYLSDVPPGHPLFAAAQWWGTVGGFHGLHPAPEKPGQRGKKILGQYYETYPGHAVEPEAVLRADLAQRWRTLALRLGVPAPAIPAADGKLTRGAWLRTVHGAR